jgi:type I restriction enzyme M protein
VQVKTGWVHSITSNRESIEEFSAVVSYEEIESTNYSFNAAQYFDIKIEHATISHDEFEAQRGRFKSNIDGYFNQSKVLEEAIEATLEGLSYEQ